MSMPPSLQDMLPVPIRARHRLLPVQEASFRHAFPEGRGPIWQRSNWENHPAHRRLAFEELFLLQLALAATATVRSSRKEEAAFQSTTPLLDKLGRVLPFQLTTAQDQVIREIFRDMIVAASDEPFGAGRCRIGQNRRGACMRSCWPADPATRRH